MQREDGVCAAIHCFDWSDMLSNFDRPGSAIIPRESVNRLADGTVTCQGNFIMQPLADAVYRAVSRCELMPAITLTSAKATVGREFTIVCGKNRTFALDPHYHFLTEHVPVILGCSQLWDLAGDHIHL